MSQGPIISRVLIVPGLSTLSDSYPQTVNLQSISIGLVIDGIRVFWGEYRPVTNDINPQSFLQEKIVPLLEGRPLAAFRAIMDDLDSLTETAEIIHTASQSKPSSVGRRRFLTGKLAADQTATTPPKIEQRPLSPILCYCISRILHTALAALQSITVTELIAFEYTLPLQPSLAPIHLDLKGPVATPDSSILLTPIQSLGYKIPGDNPHEQLGPNGAKLQRFIRQMTDLIERETEQNYRPTIHLDVAGGLGRLFEDNAGRILGALYGLEQAAHPYSLRISDPVMADDLDKQIEIMRQLVDYIRLRGMTTRLAVRSPIRSLQDVQKLTELGAAHVLELSLPQLGTVQQGMRAIQTCQRSNVAVLLRDNGTDPRFASHIALAAQPDLFGVPWDSSEQHYLEQIHTEMTQTIAWFGRGDS